MWIVIFRHGGQDLQELQGKAKARSKSERNWNSVIAYEVPKNQNQNVVKKFAKRKKFNLNYQVSQAMCSWLNFEMKIQSSQKQALCGLKILEWQIIKTFLVCGSSVKIFGMAAWIDLLYSTLWAVKFCVCGSQISDAVPCVRKSKSGNFIGLRACVAQSKSPFRKLIDEVCNDPTWYG